MKREVNVVSYGLGPIGRTITRLLLEKRGVKIIGAVDIDEKIVGKDLGEVLEIGKQIGVTVTDDPDTLFSKIKADVVTHATTSFLKGVYSQLVKCIEGKMNVVSTCEELVYPYLKNPQLSNEIDTLAKRHGVTVLSTGINPGFRGDTLPMVLTGVCHDVKSVTVKLSLDTSSVRIPLIRKLGTGLTPEEFTKKLETGELTGHVGGEESIALLANALGWELDDIRELKTEYILAEKPVETQMGTVKPHTILGFKGEMQGIRNGTAVIRSISQVGFKLFKDVMEIVIEGKPNINVKTGKIHTATGTAGMVVNCIPRVINADPGLITMKDLVLSAVIGDMRTFVK
jgi:4-hydroxy-tetrahydrodipicolinate reductase